MTNEIQKVPSKNAAAIIADAAMDDAGFQKMIKFRHGDYWSDEVQIPLGTRMLVHCVGWTKCWIHFEHRQVVERKVYRVLQQENPPTRDELDHNDPSTWPPGPDGRPADPWVYQYLLPLEDDYGEVRIFVASSLGGRRAVSDVCSAWGRRAARDENCGQPFVKLQKTLMPTKNFGDVPRPLFEIVGWDKPGQDMVEVNTASIEKVDDMNDEIPF